MILQRILTRTDSPVLSAQIGLHMLCMDQTWNRDVYKDNTQPETQALLRQVASEWQLGVDTMKDKKETWKKDLRLYANQKTNEDLIGEPLMFATFDTVFSAFWTDQLTVKYVATSEKYVEREQKLNNLAQNDYHRMDKASLDYERMWNTLFFGLGLQWTPTFNRDFKVPENFIIDPMTFYYDPSCPTLMKIPGQANGKFWGRQLTMRRSDIKGQGRYFDTQFLDMTPSIVSMHSEYAEGQKARADARGETYQGFDKLVGNNANILVAEHFTEYHGDIFMVHVEGNMGGPIDDVHTRTQFRRVEKLDWSYMPMTEWRAKKVPGSMLGISIPDLIRDKQRGMSKFFNLTVKQAEYSAYNMFTYDKTKVTPEQMAKPYPGKMIGVNGDVEGALKAVNRDGIRQDSLAIMNLLRQSAEQATASPAITQGMTPDTNRSATERAMQQQQVDKRYSLTSKLFGLSDAYYWGKIHLDSYRLFYKAGVETKVIRIEGDIVNGYQKVLASDIPEHGEMDVFVESAVLSEAKRLSDLQSFSNFMMSVQSNPNVNRTYLERHMARLSGLSEEQVYLSIPKNDDELDAERRVAEILEGKTPEINFMDHHMVYIQAYNNLSDDGKTGEIKRRMLDKHHKAMRMIKNNPQLVPAATGINPGNPAAMPVGATAGQQGATQNTSQPTQFDYSPPV